MSKSKKTQKTSFDLTPSFKTSIYAGAEGLVSNVDYLENQRPNFIQNKHGRKTSVVHTPFVLWAVIFLLVRNFYTVDDSLKVKKNKQGPLVQAI